MEDGCCRLVFGVWMLEFGVMNMEVLGLMVEGEACGWTVDFFIMFLFLFLYFILTP